MEVSGVLFTPLFSVPPELEAEGVWGSSSFFLYNLSVVPLPFSEVILSLWFECSPITCLILTCVLVYFNLLSFSLLIEVVL